MLAMLLVRRRDLRRRPTPRPSPIRQLRLEGATFTDPAAVEEALDDVRGENLFGLRTGPLEAGSLELPTVAAARTSASRLPDSLVVRLEEREAVLVWRVGARRYLVDRDGQLFAPLGDEPPAEVAGLPVVEDRRATSAGLSVGGQLDAVDLDAATRLASLVPADVGSEAEGLTVAVSDANGFVVRSRPDGWSAVFGFYTLSLRTPGAHPGPGPPAAQPAHRPRAALERVILASETDGTYIPKPTPKPTPKPKRRRERRGPSPSGSLAETTRSEDDDHVLLPLLGLLVGVLAGLVLNVNVGFELSRYSAVAILAALDSVLGAVRAELDGVYDNRIFISGFLVNAIIAVLLTFIGDRLGLDLYLVALITFGLRIFDNVALIRRHFL